MDDHISHFNFPLTYWLPTVHSTGHCILPVSPHGWGPFKKPPGRLTIHMAHVWCPLKWIPFFSWPKKRSSQGPQSPWSVAISLPSQDYLFPYIFPLLLLWRLSRTTLKPFPLCPKVTRELLFLTPVVGVSPALQQLPPRGTLNPSSPFLLFKGCQCVTINAVRPGFTISQHVLNTDPTSYSFITWCYLAPIVIFSDFRDSAHLLSNKKSWI